MNGTNRLYRSTSQAMIGGVAAGLGNYFKIDPVLVRAGFVILAFITGGAFILPYLVLWFLIPTAGSTAATPGAVVQENLDEIGSKLRGVWNVPGNGTPGAGPGNGGSTPTNGTPGNPGNSANFASTAETPGAGTNVPNGGPVNGTPGNGNSVQAYQTYMHSRYGLIPIALISIGVLVLASRIGLFHILFGLGFVPTLLIALGVYFVVRHRSMNRW